MRAAAEDVQACPECGAGIKGDNRYVVWCAACDWNVDPEPPDEDGDRLDRARRVLARRHGERLLAEVTAGGELRAHRDVSSVLAFGIALAVHGVTLGLACGGVWFLVRGWSGSGIGYGLIGLILLLLAWSLRPRAGRLPDDDPVLHRQDAPELYALIDEVARVVGTRTVDEVRFDAEVNAGVLSYGVRGRRVLTLGLPLWETLTPQQQIALLGHELGHYGNGDTRRTLVVWTAHRTLTDWLYHFSPSDGPAPGPPSADEIVANVFYAVPRVLTRCVLSLFDHLTLRASQRAEYLADRAAARAGSTEAAVSLMEHFFVADTATVVLRREGAQAAFTGGRRAPGNENRAEGVWDRLRAHMASVPAHEYERQRRVGVRRRHSVDSTHPPTDLRRQSLLAGPSVPAAVVADDARQGRIAAELAGARAEVARRIIRDGLDD
uniref:M48 family metallopeptidase n=1 Tax=Streptomyces polyasparticus TaxID=2767826 RepID=UPI00280AF00F|nr:M48 family metallopeptidase [Streptomyces polyasparticus]